MKSPNKETVVNERFESLNSDNWMVSCGLVYYMEWKLRKNLN